MCLPRYTNFSSLRCPIKTVVCNKSCRDFFVCVIFTPINKTFFQYIFYYYALYKSINHMTYAGKYVLFGYSLAFLSFSAALIEQFTRTGLTWVLSLVSKSSHVFPREN